MEKIWNIGPFRQWTPLKRLKGIGVRRLIEGRHCHETDHSNRTPRHCKFCHGRHIIPAVQKAVQAEVPFDFTVGNNLLPLAIYMIKDESTGLIVTKNHDKARIQPSLGLLAA
jgi:hypothetical protein